MRWKSDASRGAKSQIGWGYLPSKRRAQSKCNGYSEESAMTRLGRGLLPSKISATKRWDSVQGAWGYGGCNGRGVVKIKDEAGEASKASEYEGRWLKHSHNYSCGDTGQAWVKEGRVESCKARQDVAGGLHENKRSRLSKTCRDGLPVHLYCGGPVAGVCVAGEVCVGINERRRRVGKLVRVREVKIPRHDG